MADENEVLEKQKIPKITRFSEKSEYFGITDLRKKTKFSKNISNHAKFLGEMGVKTLPETGELSEDSSLMDDCGPRGCAPACPDKSNYKQGLLRYFQCPPVVHVSRTLFWILLIPMVWGVLVSIMYEDALPGGNLFSILSLAILAQLGGVLVSALYLPSLLGMLLVGIGLRSVPGFEVIGESIDPFWSATLRKTALVIILLRAGLGLDPKALRQLSLMVLRLGILPNVVEMLVVALVAHFLLQFPWLWSFLLGFIIAGVSPSVVVPCMLNLSDTGLGTNKGVPTLVIAGLSLDNVISISGFGVILGLIFTDGSIAWQALKGPIEVFGGLLYGTVIGFLSWHIPNHLESDVSIFRFWMLLFSGLLAIFGSLKIGYSGAGPIGCLCAAFVARIGWKKQGNFSDKDAVKENFNLLWSFFLPLLFGLIGTEIKISSLDLNTVGFGLLTLAISLSFRVATTYFCVAGGNLNVKERIFVSVAWLPKATIQAAIGSTALDIARAANKNSSTETLEENLGKQVLTIAVLVILVSAPLGATLMMLGAPKLLHKKNDSETEVSDSSQNSSLDV